MLTFPVLTAALVSAFVPIGLGAPAADAAPYAVEREVVIDFGTFGVSETKSWGAETRCPIEAPYLSATHYHPGSINIIPSGVEIRSSEWAFGGAWPIGDERTKRNVGVSSVTVTNGLKAPNDIRVVLHCVSS